MPTDPSTPELIAALKEQLSHTEMPTILWNQVVDATVILRSQAAEIARLEAQVAQLQGERAGQAWLNRVSNALYRYDHEEMFGVRGVAAALGAAPVQVSGVKLEPTSDDSSPLGAATQPEGEAELARLRAIESGVNGALEMMNFGEHPSDFEALKDMLESAVTPDTRAEAIATLKRRHVQIGLYAHDIVGTFESMGWRRIERFDVSRRPALSKGEALQSQDPEQVIE
jgi:hypothetical protein